MVNNLPFERLLSKAKNIHVYSGVYNICKSKVHDKNSTN